ncbi:MAG: adenylosuccinate lyase [Maribacter sp.]|nr:adenylosuccinate lyase [Maribacter sp.]
MTKEELYKSLDYINATRKNRMEMARIVLANPDLVMPLMEFAFEVNNPVSSKACWILEYVAKENLANVLPFTDKFTHSLFSLKLDSSIRPMAKICEMLIKAYFSKNENETQVVLTTKHLEQIATSCFDWLIGDHKVAAKAYSMTSLLLLGRKFNWIHPELKLVLEQNYASGSAAYRARARITLAKLK